MSDRSRDTTPDETDHGGDLHGGVDEFDVDALDDEDFPEDAEQPIEDEDLVVSEIQTDQDDEEIDSEETDDVPRFARLAGWFGFLLPPVGAIMGHLWLAWEGKERDAPGRRHAVTGIIVGWFMTFVLIVGALIGFTLWFEAAEDARIQEARDEIMQQELAVILEAAVDSPSAGAVDAEACDAIFAVVNPETPPEELSELIEGYESLAASDTPNSDEYASYAAYLSEFDSTEAFQNLSEDQEQERTENATEVLGALDEDSLACVAFDDAYFLDNIADRNTTEF